VLKNSVTCSNIAMQPPMTAVEGLLEEVFSVGFAPRQYSEDPWQCSSVESQSVNRRLGGWCEKASSLGASQLSGSSAWLAVTRGPEHGKLKKLLLRNGCDDCELWRLAVRCNYL
jgi:hypothetical protein